MFRTKRMRIVAGPNCKISPPLLSVAAVCMNCVQLISAVTLAAPALFAVDAEAAPLASERVILKTSLSYEQIYFAAGHTDGVFWDNKLAVNFNAFVSPYIGVTLGVADAVYILGNAGVEKAFIYNNGFSIITALGIHAGICAIDVTGYDLAGVHASAEIAFSRKRFSPYLTAGMKYTYIFDKRNMLSFPFGVGLSLKI
jgi:hypothetical protein